MYGSLRSREIQVTRERIRNSLKPIGPLGSALMSRAGLTHRRTYSVPYPNSLWHIGNIHANKHAKNHVLFSSLLP